MKLRIFLGLMYFVFLGICVVGVILFVAFSIYKAWINTNASSLSTTLSPIIVALIGALSAIIVKSLDRTLSPSTPQPNGADTNKPELPKSKRHLTRAERTYRRWLSTNTAITQFQPVDMDLRLI